MIEVGLRKDGIMISGHAGYAPTGSDIVCAGVTALTQELIRSMEGLTDDRIETDIGSGMASIQYGDLSEKGRLLIDSFFIGICMIAEKFPDYVRIT
ncbi:ribosomal-processing cysteine protease Prp [Lachnospiraceae bacterium]|nr:ribosomal-processing cysteine protease Prp [Lachnospiraceae bacterium]